MQYCCKLAVGYSYLFKYLIATPNQITDGAMVLQYWVIISRADKENPAVSLERMTDQHVQMELFQLPNTRW